MSEPVVIYWDTSALISLLFRDRYSEKARGWLRREGYHFISSLALAEVYGIIARIKKERFLSEYLIDEAYEILRRGPWRRITLTPSWDYLHSLATRSLLCGSLLWHLATVRTLAGELPELMVLSYDDRFVRACVSENLKLAEK